MRSILLLTILFITNLTNQLLAQKQTDAKASVEIAGLILDAETLQPVDEALIINDKGIEVAYTNSSGYFRASLPREDGEEVRFSFTIKKDNYESFNQKEHWGVMNRVSAAFFIGLKKKKSDTEDFSEMEIGISDLSFGTVLESYNNVKKDIDLEKSIASAKKGNDKVFFEIDGAFYIVDDWGWIRLKTKEDKIVVDNNTVVPAEQLNLILKRKSITRMSTIASEVASFEINTKK